MAQFDVYLNPNEAMSDIFPFLLDIQNDLHDSLPHRLVIPLARGQKRIQKLNPAFTILDQDVILFTEQTASIPLSYCGKKVDNLEAHSSEIFDALDFLVHGF